MSVPVHPLRTMLRTPVAGASGEHPPDHQAGMAMTTIDRAALIRHLYFHDPSAPAASLVATSVCVVVRWLHGTLLLVRRCDSGA